MHENKEYSLLQNCAVIRWDEEVQDLANNVFANPCTLPSMLQRKNL